VDSFAKIFLQKFYKKNNKVTTYITSSKSNMYISSVKQITEK